MRLAFGHAKREHAEVGRISIDPGQILMMKEMTLCVAQCMGAGAGACTDVCVRGAVH